MNINELSKLSDGKIILDGQIIYIINKEIVEKLKKDPIIDDSKMISRTLINIWDKEIKFVVENSIFIYGIYNIKSRWLGELLIRHDGRWLRVRMENTKCKSCGVHWRVANPTEYGLFDFVASKEKVLQYVENLTMLKCPQCNGNLERDAIWIDEKS